MGISCGTCDWTEGDWWYYPPEDFSLLETSRRQRCWSCHSLIDIGADCGKFSREREARHEIEEHIWGEGSVPMASKYMCETCTGLYFTIKDLGFCISLPADMREEIKVAADILKVSGGQP